MLFAQAAGAQPVRHEAGSRARISSVAFTGSVANPTITIRGSDFGARPQRLPAFRPEPPHGNQPPYACTTRSSLSSVGYDYGTRLWLVDSAQGRGWSAGRYRPTLRELDCVGLVIVGYTATKVVLRLGVDYKVHHYRLASGDPYQVAVNGADKRGVVKYSE